VTGTVPKESFEMRLQILFLTIMLIAALRPPTLFFPFDWFVAAIVCFIIGDILNGIEKSKANAKEEHIRQIHYELEAVKEHLIKEPKD